MKNIVLLIAVIFFLTNCSDPSPSIQSNVKSTSSIEEKLLEFALKEDISNETLIKSHLLLSHLVLTKLQISSLEKNLSIENVDSLKHLITNHLLWIQTQEMKYQTEFINYYPVSDNLSILNHAINNSDYRIVTSPFQNTLAYFALDNKEALVKLLKSIPYVDGADADELDNQLRNIFNINQNYFSKISTELGVDVSEIIIKQ